MQSRISDGVTHLCQAYGDPDIPRHFMSTRLSGPLNSFRGGVQGTQAPCRGVCCMHQASRSKLVDQAKQTYRVPYQYLVCWKFSVESEKNVWCEVGEAKQVDIDD
jgi:hypothetical protein